MRKKLLALVLSSLMLLSLLAGCGGKNDTGSVFWLNFKPELDEAAQELAKTYTEKTGVEVKVITAASGTYSQTLTAEMDKSAPPTLFVIGNTAGVKDWKDYALDLKDTAIAKELNTDAYNLYDDGQAGVHRLLLRVLRHHRQPRPGGAGRSQGRGDQEF